MLKIKQKILSNLNFFSYDKKNRRIFDTHKNLTFTEKENEIFLFLLETSRNNKSVTKNDARKCMELSR